MKKALYRVLRPKTFSEVIDKDIIVSVLKNQIKTNSVSHGYLFCGTRGTGKTSVAKIFSRAVNCLNPIDGEPCNQCKNCLEILEDRSVDVLELDAASNNGVDNIRELKTMGVYPPSNLKKKVYIIDEAHMLSNSAFNALLKILEEPPEHLIFILATTDPDKLPDTVKSRVQRFDFHTISKRAIEGALKAAAKKLNEELEDNVYRLIANESRGSMRDALSQLDQLLSLPTRPIKERDAVELLGVTGIYELMPLVDAIINFDYKAVIDATDELEEMGRSPEKLLYSLMEVFRDMYLLKLDENFDVLNKDEYKKIINRVSIPAILNIVEKLRLILNDITNAFDRSLVFQIGVLGIVKDEYIKSSNFVEIKQQVRTVEIKKDDDKNINASDEVQDVPVIKDNEEENTVSNDDDSELIKEDAEAQEILSEQETGVSQEQKPDASQQEPQDDLQEERSVQNENDPDGNEIYDVLVSEIPMLMDINSAFLIRLDDDKLVFRLKNPANNDERLDMFREEIEAVFEKHYNKKIRIVKENEDPNIEKAKQLFGDKLVIK